MEHKKIIWEKWVDPFQIDPNQEWPGAYDSKEDDDEDDMYDSNIYEKDIANAPKPVPLIFSPMGVIPLLEQARPSSVFNLWTGHTNFKITKSMKTRLIQSDIGIEILDIFTNYRFRVGIAKAVDTIEAKNNIQSILGISND